MVCTDSSEKAKKLANAQSLDFHLRASHPSVHELSKSLFDAYIAEPRRLTYPRVRTSLECILLNLLHVHAADSARYVRFSRRPRSYKHGRYNPQHISYDSVIRVVDKLEEVGLLELHSGIPGKESYGEFARQSRMRALPKLIDMFNQAEIQPSMIERIEGECIWLREPKGESRTARFLDYPESPKVRRMRNNLRTINNALAEKWIDLYVPDVGFAELNQMMSWEKDRTPIDFGRKRLRRIFNNGKFNEGGRFYHGWWQEVPRSFRSYVMIDDKGTIEFDYSGIHFAIFYARQGLITPDDPYELPQSSKEERGLIKKALNAVINAPTRTKAERAIARSTRYTPYPEHYPSAKVLVDALHKKHQPISHLFCTGEGLRAQYVDSQIAELVMLSLLEQEIVALPVHDSFIVQAQHADALKRAMTTSFEQVVRMECKVDAKVPTWTKSEDYFPEPESIMRTREAILSGKYDGYERRKLKWQRLLLEQHKAKALQSVINA